MNVMKEIKKEIKSINIAKKNYLEIPIDANAKVDDTFGYDGSIIVNATFSTILKALKTQKKNNERDSLKDFTTLVAPGKYNNMLVGCVALQKINSTYEPAEHEHDHDTSYAEIPTKKPKKEGGFGWFKFK